jgi:hypothetical protein
MLELLLLALIANAAYCIRKIADDWRGGRRDWAALGLLSLLGFYGILAWAAYDAMTMTMDAVARQYAR